MSGKILLDTNAIIYALNEGIFLPNVHYCTSIITEIELYSYSKITREEKQDIAKLLSYFEVLNIDQSIKEKTIEIRKNYGIKLPDSIICATAIIQDATLVSNDKQLSKVLGLNILTFREFCK